MADWRPDLSNSDKPRYLAIADAIADDIAAGRLVIGDRLPPQRKLAKTPGHRFHHCRARLCRSAEARTDRIQGRTGDLCARQAASAPLVAIVPAAARRSVDESSAGAGRSELIARMQAGVDYETRDIVLAAALPGFRRHTGGTRIAASSWLGRRALVPAQDRVFVFSRRASRAGGDRIDPRQAGRNDPKRGDYLSRHPVDCRATWRQSRWPADG